MSDLRASTVIYMNACVAAMFHVLTVLFDDMLSLHSHYEMIVHKL